ncbi:MAG: hypothetical protein ING19_05300 [Azospirillum sp.]|nr:hypothetical protein [Azospirillum sp.]
MVAPYIPPDSTSQAWANWRSGIDGAIVAGARIAVAFLPQAQDTPNMTVRVLAGPLMIGGALTEIAAQNTGTIAAPVGNPRIDRIVLNPATGAIQVVTGTPAASPVAPAIPADRLPIARFQLAPATTAITNAMIVDERVGVGSGTIADGAVTARKESDDPWSSVASAATVDLGAINSRNVLITGTTTITSFGNTGGEGRAYRVRFGGALTLTHNATSLILPGGANIATAAGDTAELVKESGTGNWRCADYQRASGQAVVAPISGPTLATPVATTSGTAIDFTGIPASAKRITISFNQVSTNGTDPLQVQLGDSGGIETTGYVATGSRLSGGSLVVDSPTAGFRFYDAASSSNYSGVVLLTLVDATNNIWSAFGWLVVPGTQIHTCGGVKALSATLDRVRLTTSGGTNAFDNGSVNIVYD